MGLEKNVVNQQTANKSLTGERIRRKLLRANVIHPTENPQSEVMSREEGKSKTTMASGSVVVSPSLHKPIVSQNYSLSIVGW